MRGYYTPDAVRAAEAPLLAALPDGALMRRAAYGIAGVVAAELRARTGTVAGRRVSLLVGSGDNGGGEESTTTPAPETTPAPTASVTTVTAVAPTATPTATPAPTAEPTATPAPAAVSAHIPQTSDDMPYTLLVVTALASLCAAGALFMKRRSK